MISKALAVITATMILGFTLVWVWPTNAPAATTPAILPGVTMSVTPSSYEPCESEDGSGQALCFWDASQSGNGMGTDVIGGECAVGSIGITDEALSILCVRVWGIPSYERIVSTDGATDAWSGREMVGECSDIEWDAMQDSAIRESLDNDGWTMRECLTVMLDNE